MSKGVKQIFLREWILMFALLVCVLGCGKLASLKPNGASIPNEIRKNAEDALKVNALADPPAPGAMVVRQLARLDPEIAPLQKTVEDLERSGLKKFTAEVAQKNKLSISPLTSRKLGESGSGRQPSFALIAAQPEHLLGMMQAQSGASPTIGVGSNDINFLVAFVSAFNDWVAPALTERGEINPSKREYNGSSYTDMSVEVGRGADGATKFGFKINTRGIDGNKSLDSDIEAKIEGKRCPDVNGNIEFTMTLKMSGKHANSSYVQDVTAKITATTNDDADTVNLSMKLDQGIQESVDGRNTYIETSYEVNGSGNSYTTTDPRVGRVSQDKGPHLDALASSGNAAAMQAGFTGLKLAEAMWQNGGCIAINANSPGTVQPSSVTDIPVNVKHKYDGSSVPAKVKVELSGETSVEPRQIDQTPGNLKYTAPPEKNKSATIKLEARSKRGRAKLDLKATTGGNAYQISGNLDEAKESGTVCDSSQPFTIAGDLLFKFSPTSPTTGNYTYSGPYNATGSGPYVINDDGTMKLDGTGCIMGGSCATYSHQWTATPIDPSECSGGK